MIEADIHVYISKMAIKLLKVKKREKKITFLFIAIEKSVMLRRNFRSENED